MCYRQTMVLRLPLSATNLAPPRSVSRTKLSLAAVTELVALAGQCEELCLTDQPIFGFPSPPTSAPTSQPNSSPSSRR